jgi:ribose transport system substrate-binding protein
VEIPDSGSRGRRFRAGLPAVAALAVALVAAGCGGSDSGSSSSSTSSGGGGGGDQASPVVAEAQALVDKATQPIEFKAPGAPIDAKKLAGKRIAIVSVDQRVPILAIANRAIQEAAAEAKMSVTLFDAKSQVTRMQQGIRDATRNADAIMLTGIPLAAVQNELKGAEKLATVSVLNNQPDASAPGQGSDPLVDATSAPSYEEGGALVAAKAIVDTKGKLNAVIFDTKEITPSPDVVRGMKSILDKCSECKIQENTTPLAEWATALTPKAQSAIRRDPNLNYILPIFDDMAVFVTAGIRQAGAQDRVKTAALDGTPAALKLVQEGDIYTANPGQPTGWLGWAAVDQAMRVMLGQKPGDPTIPHRLLTKENLQGVNVDDIDAPYGNPAYKEGFRKLWGLGG